MERSNLEKTSKISLYIMIALIIVMIIHVAIAILVHMQHPEYSAPAYTDLFNGVIYIIPIIISLTLHLIFKNKVQNK
ncbi:hypothetical protein [Clostridium sp. FP1]|uniref:hypothetical protein n=1 Tax=Clostridium sp. FP1 TaxID=2724076 RepID=UPI0013E992C8|nr:hypothetical protein [Clostridium sp. FP1]MBZ9637477.1 hypothetical protein [Clostridium sp. FP1]